MLRMRWIVKDIMSNPVITTQEETTSNIVAKIFEINSVDSVIVTNREGKPVGIITERNLVTNVLARNLEGEKVKAKEIMNRAIIKISPEETIVSAAREMNKKNTESLLVIYKNEPVGIVSGRNLLSFMPEFQEAFLERVRMEYSARTIQWE
jgi:CBS domain-containing protein